MYLIDSTLDLSGCDIDCMNSIQSPSKSNFAPVADTCVQGPVQYACCASKFENLTKSVPGDWTMTLVYA